MQNTQDLVVEKLKKHLVKNRAFEVIQDKEGVTPSAHPVSKVKKGVQVGEETSNKHAQVHFHKKEHLEKVKNEVLAGAIMRIMLGKDVVPKYRIKSDEKDQSIISQGVGFDRERGEYDSIKTLYDYIWYEPTTEDIKAFKQNFIYKFEASLVKDGRYISTQFRLDPLYSEILLEVRPQDTKLTDVEKLKITELLDDPKMEKPLKETMANEYYVPIRKELLLECILGEIKHNGKADIIRTYNGGAVLQAVNDVCDMSTDKSYTQKEADEIKEWIDDPKNIMCVKKHCANESNFYPNQYIPFYNPQGGHFTYNFLKKFNDKPEIISEYLKIQLYNHLINNHDAHGSNVLVVTKPNGEIELKAIDFDHSLAFRGDGANDVNYVYLLKTLNNPELIQSLKREVIESFEKPRSMKEMLIELGCKEHEIEHLQDREMTIMEFIPYIGKTLGMEGHAGAEDLKEVQKIITQNLKEMKKEAGISIESELQKLAI